MKISINSIKLFMFFFCLGFFVSCEKESNPIPVEEMDNTANEETNKLQAALEENTVLNLPFDGNTLDQSIYENHGESYGVKYRADRHGNPNAAIYFDGSDYVEVPHFSKINFGLDDDFAISLWVKYSNQVATYYVDNDILSKWTTVSGTGGRGYPFIIRITNQTAEKPFVLYGARHGAACLQSSGLGNVSNLNDDEFHHAVFMKKGNRLSFYLDGQLINESEQNIACDVKNTAPLYIGSRLSSQTSDKNWFTGYLDDLRILDRALDEEEVKYLFEN